LPARSSASACTPAGLIGDIWPVVAIGLYAVAALIAPRDPVEQAVEPSLTDALRAEVEELLTLVELERAAMPDGTEPVVRRIVRTVRLVLDRLDNAAGHPGDAVAVPERLADVAEIVRFELAESLDAYLTPPRWARSEAAARELRAQLELIGARTDRLAEQVPDAQLRRAGDLTRELRRRREK
jgi:hypothetical protein